jgi:hypothetical protein
MKKLLLAFALLLLAPFAQATAYFVCDCQAGADALCAGNAGSSGNDGLTATTPKQTYAQLSITTGSHTISFCKGGAWTAAAAFTPPSGTSPAAPIVFTSYAHPNFTSSAKPILRFTNNGFTFTYTSNFEVANLEITGSGAASSDGIVMSNAGYVYAHDNRITQFALGVAMSDGDKGALTSDLRLVHNTIDFNVNIGFEGGGKRVVIEDNDFDSNGSVCGFDHNIYISSNPVSYDNITVRRNRLTNALRYANASSCAVSFVVHGYVPHLLIEENYIIDLLTTAGGFCLAVDGVTGRTANPQRFEDLVIRGNHCIQAGSSNTIFQWDSAPYAIIENNVFIHLPQAGDSDVRCMVWDANTGAQGQRLDLRDTQGIGNLVRNNTCYLSLNNSAPSTVNTSCFYAGTVGLGQMTLVNNICYMANGGTAAMVGYNLNSQSRASLFSLTDYNIIFNASGSVTWDNGGNSTPSAAGETHSAVTNPLFVATPSSGNSYSVQIQSGSPAVNAGHPTKGSRSTFGRYAPVSTRDIGADEYNKSTLLPLGPSYGWMQ